MQLGIASGGVEIDSYSARRPVPTGIVSSPGDTTTAPGHAWIKQIVAFGQLTRGDVTNFTLTDPDNPAVPPDHTGAALGGTATDNLFKDANGGPDSLVAIREVLGELGTAIESQTNNRWKSARQGLRLALLPRFGSANTGLASILTTAPAATDLGDTVTSRIFSITGGAGSGPSNVAAYTLGRMGGAGGAGLRQTSAAIDEGSDGTTPTFVEYQTAFEKIESALPSFNIMVLPRADQQTDTDRRKVWGLASASCARRRAILLVDPDESWTDYATAKAGVDTIKIGVEIRNSAIFWPRLKVPQAASPLPKPIDPSGSIAGLMARTDGRFGVWAAPAGLEATLRGIVGLTQVISDEENGALNPKALNAIRQFPLGAVAWGARMMVGSDDSGNIDDKYIPVRRTMLFIEESLYRGLKFAIFRPNAEPLWASIRLAVGSFMNSLMRQGAFASTNKLEAYYVLCDATTTTETDRNLGIVNVIVGFAPLKPSEFIVLTVTQIAGQVEV